MEGIGLERLALLERSDREADGRAHDGDTGVARLTFQGREDCVAADLRLLRDRVATGPVGIALEGGHDRGLDLATQLRHRDAEHHRLAGRQLQRTRPLRVGEVVDVAPVVRDGLLGGLP